MLKGIEVINCGVIEYGEAWELQKGYFQAKIDDSNGDITNKLLFCEHPHVYTLGKSGVEENLLVDSDFLGSIGATYFRTDRGGDITYHGYGQLVGYPIICVNDYSLGLREYIFTMEQAVINAIAHFGIEGFRVDGATGVWINEQGQERKICAIGVKASRYITMHGFALNVNTDLSYFSYINPCGFTTRGVTSIANNLKVRGVEQSVTLEEVMTLFANEFTALLRCNIL